MVGVEVAADYGVGVGVGGEDFLEWKIVTILTACGGWYVDVFQDKVVLLTMDGYALELNVGIIFDGSRGVEVVEGDVVLDKEGEATSLIFATVFPYKRISRC